MIYVWCYCWSYKYIEISLKCSAQKERQRDSAIDFSCGSLFAKRTYHTCRTIYILNVDPFGKYIQLKHATGNIVHLYFPYILFFLQNISSICIAWSTHYLMQYVNKADRERKRIFASSECIQCAVFSIIPLTCVYRMCFEQFLVVVNLVLNRTMCGMWCLCMILKYPLHLSVMQCL